MTLTQRFRFVVVGTSLVERVLVRAASCACIGRNIFIVLLFFNRGKDACGIIMTVCPSASVHYRHHSRDIFKGVKNFYDA